MTLSEMRALTNKIGRPDKSLTGCGRGIQSKVRQQTKYLLVSGLVETDIAVDGAHHKEDQHRVEKDQASLGHKHVVYCVHW